MYIPKPYFSSNLTTWYKNIDYNSQGIDNAAIFNSKSVLFLGQTRWDHSIEKKSEYYLEYILHFQYITLPSSKEFFLSSLRLQLAVDIIENNSSPSFSNTIKKK